MKSLLTFLTSGLITFLLLMSCSKESAKPAVAPAGSVMATVDGTSWTGIGAAVIANGSITIAGQDANNKGIQLSILKNTVKGTYDIKGSTSALSDATISMTPPGEVAYASVYFTDGLKIGSITITEIDETNKTISGSFNGKVKRFIPAEKEVEIKGGSFTKVAYTTKPATTTNTFSAKVSGTLLDATIITGVKALGTITLNFSTADAKKIIVIQMPDNVTTGSHAFGNFGANYFALYTLNSESNESVSGSVNITSYDTSKKHIEGTFSFSAEPLLGGTAIPITEGSFKVTYN